MKFRAAVLALLLTASLAHAQIAVPLGPNGGSLGGGGGGGSGTVTSVATSCGVSGGPITGTGTVSGNSNPNVQSGANYPFVTGDCGSIVYLSNASNQIPTIPQAGTTGFAKGFSVEACNIGAGTQTITPATSTIGGAATYVLAAGTAAAPKCIGINSDGTNYVLDLTGVGGGGAPSGAAGGDLAGTYPNPTLGFASASAAAAAADANTFPTNQGAGTLKQTLAAIKTWIQGWIVSFLSPRSDYVANNWYIQPSVGRTANTGQAHGTGQIHCKFSYYPISVTIKALGAPINTAGSTNFQLALYGDASGLPVGSPLNNTGNILDTSTGPVSGALGGNVLVGPGTTNGPRIWHCSMANDATVVFVGEDINSPNMGQLIGSATLTSVMGGTTGAQNQVGIRCTSGCNGGTPSFGSWPNLTGTTWATENVSTTGNAAPVQLYQVVP